MKFLKISYGFVTLFTYLCFLVMTPLFFKDSQFDKSVIMYGVLYACSFAIPDIKSFLFNSNFFISFAKSMLFYIPFYLIIVMIKGGSALSPVNPVLLVYNYFVVSTIEESFRNMFLVKFSGVVLASALFVFLHYFVYQGNFLMSLSLFGFSLLWTWIYGRFGIESSIGAHAGYNHALMVLGG